MAFPASIKKTVCSFGFEPRFEPMEPCMDKLFPEDSTAMELEEVASICLVRLRCGSLSLPVVYGPAPHRPHCYPRNRSLHVPVYLNNAILVSISLHQSHPGEMWKCAPRPVIHTYVHILQLFSYNSHKAPLYCKLCVANACACVTHRSL